MNKIAQKVYDLALPVAEKMNLDIWDVEYLKEAGQWFLRVYIDRAEGGIQKACGRNYGVITARGYGPVPFEGRAAGQYADPAHTG